MAEMTDLRCGLCGFDLVACTCGDEWDEICRRCNDYPCCCQKALVDDFDEEESTNG